MVESYISLINPISRLKLSALSEIVLSDRHRHLENALYEAQYTTITQFHYACSASSNVAFVGACQRHGE